MSFCRPNKLREVPTSFRTAVVPNDIQPTIYKYGIGAPFYNVNRAARTVSRPPQPAHSSSHQASSDIIAQIIFNTRNQIGQNAGILLAWAVVSMITISLATWLMRRTEVNKYRKQLDSNSEAGIRSNVNLGPSSSSD